MIHLLSGNILVIYVVASSPRMRTVTNYLIASLGSFFFTLNTTKYYAILTDIYILSSWGPPHGASVCTGMIILGLFKHTIRKNVHKTLCIYIVFLHIRPPPVLAVRIDFVSSGKLPDLLMSIAHNNTKPPQETDIHVHTRPFNEMLTMKRPY